MNDAVTAVLAGTTVRVAADHFGLSKSAFHRAVTRYRIRAPGPRLVGLRASQRPRSQHSLLLCSEGALSAAQN